MALPASEADAIGVPVTAISQPETERRRLRLSGGCQWGRAEAVAVLAFDAADRPSISHAACSTPHPKHAWDSADRCRRMAGIEGAERARANRCSWARFLARRPAGNDPVLAANGQPMVLAGRQALPYHPVVSGLNGQTGACRGGR